MQNSALTRVSLNKGEYNGHSTPHSLVHGVWEWLLYQRNWQNIRPILGTTMMAIDEIKH